MEEVKKPYEFRKLKATDLFLVTKLVSKLGLNNITNACKDDINEFINVYVEKSKQNENAKDIEIDINDSEYASVGLAMVNLVQVILERLNDCEEEIFKLLEATSNLSLQEVKDLDIDIFISMIKDFVMQEQFSQLFTQAVSLINTAQ